MKCVNTKKEGDGVPFLIKLRRPEVQDVLHGFITKDKAERSAHSRFVTFENVLSISRSDNGGVNMGPKDLSLPSRMTHVNHLSGIDVSDVALTNSILGK